MNKYEDRGPLRLWAEGLAGEALTLRRAWRPRHSYRVCIFAQGRSGSTLLVTSLDSHPQIRCEDELLRRPRLRPLSFLEGVARGHELVFGFHLKPDHLTRHQRVDAERIGEVLNALHDAGWRFVHLTRRDAVHAAFSIEYAKIHGWHHRTERGHDADRPIKIDPARFVRRVHERQTWHARERDALAGIETFPISYEDDLVDPDIRAGRLAALQQWLGVEHHPLTSPLKKSVPRSPWEMMTNAEEVRKALSAAGIEAD